MPGDPCPRCRGTNLVAMEVVTANQGGGFVLRPRHCKGWDVRLALASPFSSCLSCGLVWSAMDPGSLRTFIQSHGNELVRQHLDGLDHGPYRDLPDSELARKIGEAIAEIDGLLIAGALGAAGRYRELRGVTWDQAIRDVKAWPQLTRGEKLELFGWAAKEKKEAADLDFDAPFP